MNIIRYEHTRLQRYRQTQRRKSIARGLLVVCIALISVFYGFSQHYANSSEIISPLATDVLGAIISPTPILIPTSSPSSSDLQEVIEKSLVGSEGDYGIAIKNLATGESYYINEYKKYDSASLYKMWVMATAFKQIENGILKEDEVLSQQIAVLNKKFNIDPKVAEQTKGTISLRVAQALEQMITISHNYAALLLTEKIKLSSVATFLKENGFSESKVGTTGSFPSSSPYEIALFFEKLYNGELGNEEMTEKMITLLKRQRLNSKLPKYLSLTAVVAHKTGELDPFSHDGGIVYTTRGDYIIVVLSKTSSRAGADERIANISKAVYDYFTLKE